MHGQSRVKLLIYLCKTFIASTKWKTAQIINLIELFSIPLFDFYAKKLI